MGFLTTGIIAHAPVTILPGCEIDLKTIFAGA
jgi:hypothetical protein